MGTYLTTAIIRKISISKSDVEQLGNNETQNIKKIQEKLGGVGEEIFDVKKTIEKYRTRTHESYDFTLKDAILKKEWIPFLNAFYNDFYGKDKECDEVLEKLNQLEQPQEWLKLAEDEEEYYECYRDNYGIKEGILIEGHRISTFNYNIMLTFEGKVMAEACEQHLSFFEKMIARAYPQFRIANLIRVFITG